MNINTQLNTKMKIKWKWNENENENNNDNSNELKSNISWNIAQLWKFDKNRTQEFVFSKNW